VDENRPPQALLDDQLLEKVLRDMDDLKSSWLENMATDLGIEVTDLDFVNQAYEEIAECRRRIWWVHAYGYHWRIYRYARHALPYPMAHTILAVIHLLIM
jgi:hypothetical protein